MLESKLFNVVIIGAGQLGSRYLQGIVSSKLNIKIFVVDPSQNSLDICKKRINEKNTSFDYKNYYELLSIKGLPKIIDLVIIATQSDIRFKVLKNLTEQSHVINFMILEKVLFQNINEYDLSSEIIKNRQIKCWVNCTRRAFPIYQKIKSYLNDEISNLRFKVAGGEWGLMSNSIHFLDTISYITENSDIKITQISKLIDPINSISKRKNVYESSGKIEGICGDSNFVFISKKSSDDDLVFSVESNSMKIIINETQGLAKFTKSKHSYKETFVIPYLSQFSINIVENILLTSECGLPYLENSIALHKPLIQELSSYFKRNFDQDFCPLT
jgi:hypothetical protein